MLRYYSPALSPLYLCSGRDFSVPLLLAARSLEEEVVFGFEPLPPRNPPLLYPFPPTDLDDASLHRKHRLANLGLTLNRSREELIEVLVATGDLHVADPVDEAERLEDFAVHFCRCSLVNGLFISRCPRQVLPMDELLAIPFKVYTWL